MKEALDLGVSYGGVVRRSGGREHGIAQRVLWLMALAIAIPILFVGQAAWAGDVGYLSVGGVIGYGGYSTNYFSVDGQTAYCATPSKGTPSSGTYSMTETSNESLAAALWYGWGGPGFDASMWPSTWYDGSSLDAGKYAALTHILVSDCYGGNGNEAYGQCSRVFQEWCQQYIVGYSIDDGSRINGNALGVKLHERGFAAGSAGSWPKGFSAYVIETRWSTQTIATFRYAAPGAIEVNKVSSDKDLVAGNECYSLEGAVYGVYSDKECVQRVGKLTTDRNGHARCGDLAAGSYWVREEQAPEGFLIDEEVRAVSFGQGETVVIESHAGSKTVADGPRYAKAGLLIEKRDAEVGVAQGSATLQGAQFEISFYGGYYESADEAMGSGNPLRSWTVQTDAQGRVCLGGDGDEGYPYLLGGDAWWTDSSGDVVFPLGTLVIRESAPPNGYLLDEDADGVVLVVTESVTASGVANGALVQVSSFADEVVRGGVAVEKVDAETGKYSSLGAASLEGVVFAVVSKNENAVCVDGLMYEYGQTITSLVLKDGTAQTPIDYLPYGSYALEEIAVGEGYVARAETTFAVSENHRLVKLGGAQALKNQVIRGDVSFKKLDEKTGEPMEGVAFRVTSTTTGESHIVTSDAEGVVSTASSHAAHTCKTNANDNVAEEEDYDATAGVWFGLTSEGVLTTPRDDLGALPYDTYLIEEIPCKGNEGRQLVEPFAVVIGSNNVVVDIGLIEDKTATIATTAHFASKDGSLSKKMAPSETTRIVDKVRYANVVGGRTYEARGWLVDADTGDVLSVNGVEVRASTTFVANERYGEAEVVFDLDSSSLNGRSVVVFEELVCDGRVIAKHCDRLDDGQTVRFEEPSEPHEPDEPDKPQEPDEPDEPRDPEEPADLKTTDSSDKKSASTLAKTGDEEALWGGVLVGISCVCSAVLFACLALRGRKRG